MGGTIGFSHKWMAEEALKIKIRRAITQVQGDNPNSDVAVRHPEWVRESQNKKYTELIKSVTDQIKKNQGRALERRNRLGGKD